VLTVLFVQVGASAVTVDSHLYKKASMLQNDLDLDTLFGATYAREKEHEVLSRVFEKFL